MKKRFRLHGIDEIILFLIVIVLLTVAFLTGKYNKIVLGNSNPTPTFGHPTNSTPIPPDVTKGPPDIPTTVMIVSPTIIDLADSNVPDSSKYVVIVKLTNGSFVKFIAPASYLVDIRSNLNLHDGDIIVTEYLLFPPDSGPIRRQITGTIISPSSTSSIAVTPSSTPTHQPSGYPPPYTATAQPYP
jgi:hypothetical protein